MSNVKLRATLANHIDLLLWNVPLSLLFEISEYPSGVQYGFGHCRVQVQILLDN